MRAMSPPLAQMAAQEAGLSGMFRAAHQVGRRLRWRQPGSKGVGGRDAHDRVRGDEAGADRSLGFEPPRQRSQGESKKLSPDTRTSVPPDTLPVNGTMAVSSGVAT